MHAYGYFCMKIKIFEQYQEIGFANLLVWFQQHLRKVPELPSYPAADYRVWTREIRRYIDIIRLCGLPADCIHLWDGNLVFQVLQQ